MRSYFADSEVHQDYEIQLQADLLMLKKFNKSFKEKEEKTKIWSKVQVKYINYPEIKKT